MADLRALRARLDVAFAPDTASPETISDVPSAGHCAVVALLVQLRFDAALVSTREFGRSHWFNLIRTDVGWVEADLTGDQFGRGPVRCATTLHNDTRIRRPDEVSEETHARYLLLLSRTGA